MRIKRLGSLPAAHALPIAVDFGASGLKVLQVAGGEPTRLVAASFLPTPDEFAHDPAARLRFQIERLPKLIRKGGFTTKRAVCLIPASQMFCKHMQLQLSEGVSIDSLLQALLPSQVGCDYESLVCRSVEVPGGGRGGKTEVICMAASRDLVGRLMQALKSAHLEPVGVHAPFQSVLRSFHSVRRREEDALSRTLYLDLGYSSTNVMIAHGQDLVFARTVDLGGQHLDAAIMKQRNITLSEARKLRKEITVERRAVEDDAAHHDAGEEEGTGLALLHAAMAKSVQSASDSASKPQSAPVVPASAEEASAEASTLKDQRVGLPTPGMSPRIELASGKIVFPRGVNLSEPLEILSDEIAMSVRYHKSMFGGAGIDRAVLVGGEAKNAWLCQHLARALRVPVEVGDPLALVSRNGSERIKDVDFSKAQPGWAAALGMALSPTDL
ncbi:MAG: hypothetical protein D6695_09390 [Planctomycetota bacterium]|nr:MAG: hypothetical protein D6695_09390 [Planctomycetota bacterium]